jgi:hypothetical protein
MSHMRRHTGQLNKKFMNSLIIIIFPFLQEITNFSVTAVERDSLLNQSWTHINANTQERNHSGVFSAVV